MNSLSQIIDDKHMVDITANFTRLRDQCYLDNAGAALYPQCLITKVHADLMNNVYMNPHSDNYTKDCVDQIRSVILGHFNSDPLQYTVVFTSGTTQALKLVAESFQFFGAKAHPVQCGTFVYLRVNHTSVLGLREIAAAKGATVVHMSHEDFLRGIRDSHTDPKKNGFKDKGVGNNLFAYPAQNNYNGYKYPINHIENMRNGCLNKHIVELSDKPNCNWYVLLDAASYVSTNILDLSKSQPDFVALSFYKIFGYPTGLGALLVKNSSQHILNQKKYFGGGTVDVVLSAEDFHEKKRNLSESLEDGTIPFLSILSLRHCFDTMHEIIPKTIHNDVMETISYHTFDLAKYLFNQLKDLTHRNDNKVAVIYADSDYSDIREQGAIVTFNLLREDGSYIGYSEFQHMAELFHISVRTGCFCNSGSCQRHLVVSSAEIKERYTAGHVCGDETDVIDGRPTGAVRVSFAYFNTYKDVDKLIGMIRRCFVKTKCKHSQCRTSLTHRSKLERTKSRNFITIYNFHDPWLP